MTKTIRPRDASPITFRSLPARQIINKIAEQHHLDPDTIRTKSKRRHIARARAECYIALRDDKNFSWQQIANLFGVKRESVRSTYKNNKSRACVRIENSQEYIEALEDQLRRLAGVELAHKVGAKLGTPPWSSIFLSILIAAYPRTLTADQLCELYDEAAARLNHGNGSPVGPNMTRTFVTTVRKLFAQQGLPNPIMRHKPGGMRLSDEVAPWMSAQFGSPVIYETPPQSRPIHTRAAISR